MSSLVLNFNQVQSGAQTRVKINSNVVKKYAQLMVEGIEFPLPVVFDDGSHYFLADGYHRIEAFKLNNATGAEFEVIKGTLEDAIIYNLTNNSKTGLPMSNADKKNAVCLLLTTCPLAAEMSDREISRISGVDHKTVGKYRKMYAEGKDPMGSKDKDSNSGSGSDSDNSDSSSRRNYKEEVAELENEIERLRTMNAELTTELHLTGELLKNSTIHGKLNRKEFTKLLHPDQYSNALKDFPELLGKIEKALQLINSCK